VRIEDTDRERSKKEYEDNIWETISWLGLLPDRKFRQSEHVGRHTELLQKLIDEGKAYISKEEIKKEGDRAEVIRFKNPNKSVTFIDLIRGPITIDTTDLGDFVIARSLEEPVFHLAVVVDDADAGVTHIVRGEDHISNTPRQILITEALGFAVPTYAHLPLVLDATHAKLSKRRGAKALTEYRSEGYLPGAMINYLTLLGWHPEGEQEVFSVEALIQVFSLERIQKSAGIFDEMKLKWFNHEHMKLLSAQDFKHRLGEFFALKNTELPAYIDAILPLLRERSQIFIEAYEAVVGGEYDFMFNEPTPTKELLLQGAKAEAREVVGHLTRATELLEAISGDVTAEVVKEAVFPYATEVGRGKVLWPMRVALSGKEKSPDPFTLCALLGKEKSIARIKAAQDMLQ
ncbi:MAG: glutamate--tRNA ligase, partial [Patescibacteria group bacterium]